MSTRLITSINTLLDELASLALQTSEVVVIPTLLVQPPETRGAHTSDLREKSDQLETLIDSVASLQEKCLSTRNLLLRQRAYHQYARTPISALPASILCDISQNVRQSTSHTHRDPLWLFQVVRARLPHTYVGTGTLSFAPSPSFGTSYIFLETSSTLNPPLLCIISLEIGSSR